MNAFIRSLFPRPAAFAIPWSALLLVLLVLPLFVFPPAVDSFVLSKRVFVQTAAFLLFGLLVGLMFLGREIRFLLQPVNGVLALMFAWGLTTVFWSEAPVLTLEATWYFAGALLVILVYQSLVEGSRTRLLRVAQVLMAASLIVALWTLIWDFRAGFNPGSFAIRRTLGDWRDYLSTVAFGNTSHLADFLVLGFLLWMGAFLMARAKVTVMVVLAGLWLHAAALVVSWSVHSNLSLLVGAGVLAWLVVRSLGMGVLLRRRSQWTTLIAGWVVVVLFFVVDHPANPHGSAAWGPVAEMEYRQAGVPVPEGGFSGGIFGQAFSSPRWVAGWDTRVAIWLTSLEIVRLNTWLGAGAGTFTYVYPATISSLVANNPRLAHYSGSWTNAAHNDALEYWAETGIIGAFLLVILVAVSIKQHWDRLDAAMAPGNVVILGVSTAALAAICLQGQMNFPLQLPASQLFFLMLLCTPFLLPAKGGELRDLHVPVERHYGPVAIGIRMKNMAVPTEFSLRWVGESRQIAWGLAGVALLVAMIPAWMSLQPLRADVAYREVRERKLRAAMTGMSESDARAIFEGAERLLAIWPGHVDCRSAYQDALLEMRRFEDVVKQTPLVLRKLNATEVYERRAVALEALGRHDEAVADWAEVFYRRPDYGMRYPQQYNAWVARLRESGIMQR